MYMFYIETPIQDLREKETNHKQHSEVITLTIKNIRSLHWIYFQTRNIFLASYK